jgi:hypothetical protein
MKIYHLAALPLPSESLQLKLKQNDVVAIVLQSLLAK